MRQSHTKRGLSSGPPCLVLHVVHRSLSVTVVNKGKAMAVSGKPAAPSLEKISLIGRVLILCSYIATL